jgi:putative spermidine/putrescine transport system ATP-binding protein
MSQDIEVKLIGLSKYFGEVRALNDFSLEMKKGELVALLGPSGCGKTTALRALAGLQPLDSGKIFVNDKDITDLPTNKRNMGMVFQSYSLFPHMSALENVEYGLKMRFRKVSTSDRQKKSKELLDLVDLASHMNHFPHQLSGGQQQRIALARALAISPNVLLLDEPLSALDAKVRSQLRDEIRRIQLEVGTTTLFVTHDQEEALGVADRVGVMKAGVLEQIASPAELYDKPASSFVAEFVGLTNPIDGEVHNRKINVLGQEIEVLPGSAVSGRATALIRPESISLSKDLDSNAQVITISFLGSMLRVLLKIDGGPLITAQLPSSDSLNYRIGDKVSVRIIPVPVFAKSS